MDRATYTIKEAAERLGISQTKMYQLVRENRVPNLKLGKRYVIPKRRFEAWIDQETVGGI